ncbi:UDP-N-acetylmuramate--L-alanine ligase [bacterium BMS3Abin02]|nr:UDP-N-acetylmuramate--L-alanine ligase [bacterium BMS3Abin02]GBE21319.1 UDP-N-acetylmuramate--L-alanine ligase [bacterium BMS3Bbin01]HDK45405.1 UDP-N-acetylmuramate--L-alanine ligase [Actinomycetota bacterium]
MAELADRIHIVGVGGSGMSALAKLLSGLGHRVSGSDIRPSIALERLSDLGIKTWAGSSPDAMADAGLVVASSAIPDSDPELRAATAAGIAVWDRPRLLEVLTSRMPAVSATGTHGKTTSSALLVAAARGAGLEPSFVVGGELIGLGTNAAVGTDDLFILEADEAFGTFLSLHLRALMVTNVEADHLDHYGSTDALEDAFVEVVRNVDGPVVICADDPGARRVAQRTDRPTYGLSDDARWRIADLGLASDAVRFSLMHTTVTVPRPGLHIARNAAGVLALAAELGLDIEGAAAGMEQFRGVRRRFELRGRVAGVTVIDDYAHHPTEIAATIEAATRGEWRRVWAVFQPHRYSRTKELHREFGAAFSAADEVVVTDIYAAGETPVPGVTGELVADAARARTSSHVTYVPHRADLGDFLAQNVRPGDLVLTLGAGDITLLGSELVRLLEER